MTVGVDAAAAAAAGRPRVAVVIPVLNEQEALPHVLRALPHHLVDEVVVVDNGSTDRSAEVARANGARVVFEPHRGYGAACLAGIAALAPADIVVFLDGDHSDHPEELPDLLAPIAAGEADLVIGSRTLRPDAQRALLPQARFGNWLASTLMRLLFGIRCSDLGPFRAIRHDCLRALGMQDRDFGWTVEMQLRAARRGLRVREVPVRYRARIGESKITGTLRGSVRAGIKILRTIFAYRLRRLPPPTVPPPDVPPPTAPPAAPPTRPAARS